MAIDVMRETGTIMRAVRLAAFVFPTGAYGSIPLEAHVYVDGFLRLRVACRPAGDRLVEIPALSLECMFFSRVTLRFGLASTGDEQHAPCDPAFENMLLPEGDALTWRDVMLYNRTVLVPHIIGGVRAEA